MPLHGSRTVIGLPIGSELRWGQNGEGVGVLVLNTSLERRIISPGSGAEILSTYPRQMGRSQRSVSLQGFVDSLLDFATPPGDIVTAAMS